MEKSSVKQTLILRDIFSQKTPLQPPAPVEPSVYNVNGIPGSNLTKIGNFNGYPSSGNFWNPPNPNHLDGYDKKVYRQNSINNNLGYFNPNYYMGATFNPNYDSTDWFRQGSSGVTHYNPAEWWKLGSSSNEVSSARTARRNVSRPARRRRNAELVRAASARKLSGAEALRIALGLARCNHNKCSARLHALVQARSSGRGATRLIRILPRAWAPRDIIFKEFL
ncbi:hypothetical protein EVAR_5644_1 [Eumeta japonica]|uniref:Uncharacterized protein n=1 Tax=Eumeta variegata TaxID=151549 RepID=A0A4C1T734_EUMVA|nr:hypothetical protein EVAR_5644_1 [Eumeta japonica]